MVGRSRRLPPLQPLATRARAVLVLATVGLGSSCALVIGVDGNYIEGELGGAAGNAGSTTTTLTGGGGATTTTLFGGGGTTTTTLPGGGGSGGNPLLVNGAPCALGADCQSSHCVDDVCCNEACNAACVSCHAADTGGPDGTCAPVSAGLDPAADCVPPEWCDGQGGCTDVGIPCPTGTECTSHDCVDGACCESSCDGPCEACDGTTTTQPDGTCAPVPAGQSDPDHCQPAEVCGPSGCLDCALEPPPPGANCPSDPCDGGCTGNVCRILCDANNECRLQHKICPAGFACEVVCSGSNSCEGATITCPAEYACDVQCNCSGPSHSCCDNTTVECGTGTCQMQCGAAANACTDATVECGLRDCGASCSGATAPTVNCSGTGCSCTAC